MLKTILLAVTCFLGLNLNTHALNRIDKDFLRTGIPGGCVGESRDCNDTYTRAVEMNDKGSYYPELTLPDFTDRGDEYSAVDCNYLG